MTYGKTIFLLISTILLVVSNPVLAETSFLKNEHNIKEMNQKFKNPNLNLEHFRKRFEAKDREVFTARKKIVKLLDIKNGSTIADLGAGTGIFIELFSKSVGENGRVYAVDISPRFISYIRDLTKKNQLKNVSCVLSTEDSACLPKSNLDLVFIANTYHHFENPRQMMKSVHDCLKPDGKLVIIDFDKKNDSRKWIKKHIHKDAKAVTKELLKFGFIKIDTNSVKELKENYFLVFAKAKIENSSNNNHD